MMCRFTCHVCDHVVIKVVIKVVFVGKIIVASFVAVARWGRRGIGRVWTSSGVMAGCSEDALRADVLGAVRGEVSDLPTFEIFCGAHVRGNDG
jgi:hypothetical protein